jgi:type IV secretory pathway VirB10-like protein
MLGTKTRISRLKRAALAGALGIGLIAAQGAIGAWAAEEEDDEPFEAKIVKGIMSGLGVKSGPNIDYRERSPLVVPPKLDLPPPEAAGAPKNPAWPVDADEKKRKQASGNRKNSDRRDPDEGARPLRPDELRRGPPPSADNGKPPSQDERDSGRQMQPAELGWTGGIKDFFGVKREEYVEFTKEPERGTLLEPPPGYRTPSPAQPYGTGTRKNVAKPTTLEDRAVGPQN